MNIRKAIVMLATLALSGCGSAGVILEPVASHTLRAAEGSETDVVWVQQFDQDTRQSTLHRCHQTASGPQCQQATVAR